MSSTSQREPFWKKNQYGKLVKYIMTSQQRRACIEEGCAKVAQGGTDHCVAHGGGKRCVVPECKNAVRFPSNLCIAHGGGPKCDAPGCTTSTQSGSDYCFKHSSPEWRAIFNTKKNTYRRARYANDDLFRLMILLRVRVSKAVERGSKNSKSIELLGCSIEEYRTYLERKFKDRMSWENAGEWHIDHIIPVDAFDLSDPEQQKNCFHYTNTQPMWAEDNWIKGSRILPEGIVFEDEKEGPSLPE